MGCDRNRHLFVSISPISTPSVSRWAIGLGFYTLGISSLFYLSPKIPQRFRCIKLLLLLRVAGWQLRRGPATDSGDEGRRLTNAVSGLLEACGLSKGKCFS